MKVKKKKKIVSKSGCFLILFFIFFIALVGLGYSFIPQIIITLLLGWISFLYDVLTRITIDPLMIVEGVLVVGVLIGGVHWFLSWFYDHYNFTIPNPESPPKVKWKLKWSMSGVFIFLLMFVTSISITGIIHETGWLVKTPLTESSWSRLPMMLNSTQQILQGMGEGLDRYYQENQNLPIVAQPVPFREIRFPKEYYQGVVIDQWGTPIMYFSDGDSYVLRSYGENRILGGGQGEFDDFVYVDGEFMRDQPFNN